MEPKDLSSLIETGAMGTLIVLVSWMVRRVFTHTIPRLATDFKEALTSQQHLFVSQLESEREDFNRALSEQRTDFRESLKDEREQLGHKLDRLSDAVETLTDQGVRRPSRGRNGDDDDGGEYHGR